ncbi:MAG: glycosyltransferase [Ignavibacteria bacterium]|nr:glycosyltransferase [Ignavibacteria bacterium]
MNGEKPLNIAYLSVFYPYRGGIAQFNAALYRALEQLGHVQSAYTFTRQYPDFLFPGSSQFVNEHDSADPIPAKRILDTVNPFNWFSVASEIKAQSPDLLLTQLWMPFMGPAFGTIARRMEDDCIKLCVVHNAIPHESRPGDTAFTKYMLSAQDGLIAISDAVEHDLKSMNLGKPILRKEHPIYTHFGNPVSQYEARERLGLPHDKQIILFFGFIREYKGLMNLIESLKSLPESIHLVIAGEIYGSFDHYDATIERLGLQHRIHKHIRYVSDDETPLFFCSADACVLPYANATQSGIVAIAHHFETPVLATPVGGLPEAVRHGQAGMLFKGISASDIADGIRSFFEDSMAQTCIDGARKLKKELSWTSLAADIVKFYHSIKHNHHP